MLIAGSLLNPIEKPLVPSTLNNGTHGIHLDAPGPLEVYSLSVAKPPLTCVRHSTPKDLGPNPSIGYCFEAGRTALRLSGLVGLDSAYNKIGNFQGKHVSLETDIAVNGHELIRIHVDSLAGISPSDETVFIPNGPVTPRSGLPVQIAQAVMAGRKISGEDPVYPTISVTNRQVGLIVLDVVVNEEGKVDDVKVLETPSDRLGLAAATAIRTWKYDPYLQNGAPVKVDTTVQVLYRIAN